ncbi:hypothetical protein [Pseudomonas oryzihabitans]|uniref:hypothetical protein n=1 Tax=Pseudomonas oryzihabitans TaxID=47885 RepID=UPI0016439F28|nr:hypothetical protein [Pseudomonas oryzihabitans]
MANHTLNPSAIILEQRKAYCAQLVKTMLRYSSPDEIQRLTSLLEMHAGRQLAVRYNPGLNDAKYDLFRRFWLKGGAQ